MAQSVGFASKACRWVGEQVSSDALGGTTLRSFPNKDIICSATDDVAEVGSTEGRDHEINRTSFHGLHVKSHVHKPCYDHDLDRIRRPFGNCQNISPSSVRPVILSAQEKILPPTVIFLDPGANNRLSIKKHVPIVTGKGG